jgi:exopolysaccharide biosynthesis polyprenyl glycosylphosphotransferase
VSRCSGLALFRVTGRPLPSWRQWAKAAQDKCLAIGFLLALMPLMLVTAVLIKLDSPGPVFFRQRRYGFNGREIEVWKFRTMYADQADESGKQQTHRYDPRVTRLGRLLRKTSIDELPQLFNVLSGDMSIVGPRPHPIGMRTDNRLSKEIVAEYAHRYRVKPGITGWAQVNGYRGATHTADLLQKRVEYDLYYIENWSLMFDLRIILLTGLRVLTMRDAY